MTRAKRKALVGVGVGLLVVGGFVLIGLIEQSADQSKLETARERAVRNRIPLNEQEFFKAYPIPTEPENAWPLYVEAIQLYRPVFGTGTREERFSRQTEAEEELAFLLSDFNAWFRTGGAWRPDSQAYSVLRRFQPVIEKAKEASRRPGLFISRRFEAGIAADYPELAYVHGLANLLLYDALVASFDEDRERAASSIAAAAKIARHILEFPIWDTTGMGPRMASNTLAVTKWLISTGRWPEERTGELGRAIEPALYVPNLKEDFRAFVYRGLSAIESLGSLKDMQDAGLERWEIRRNAPRPAGRETAELAWLEAANRILSGWPSDEQDYAGIRKVLEDNQEDMASAVLDYNRLLSVRMPPPEQWLSPVFDAAVALTAKVRLMKGFLAALDKKSAGSLPSELPLSGIDAIDPYSGKPLRFQSGSGEFAIWSLGYNRVDDGGSTVREGRLPQDWVVRYPSYRPGW